MKNFTAKLTSDNYACLNLACGTKTDSCWNNLDFSPYTRLRKRMWFAKFLKSIGLISARRWQRLNEIDPSIISWDLRNGIPFSDDTFDAIYHSHFLEHLPRDGAGSFLKECFRVCKPGGLIRIVVPDLEALSKAYLDAIDCLSRGEPAWPSYDKVLGDIFEQMIRTKTAGSAEQSQIVARIERFLRGGPDLTGELHRWMYDRFSLRRQLEMAGFSEFRVMSFDSSRIANWELYQLDRVTDGGEYKPGSIYVEAIK